MYYDKGVARRGWGGWAPAHRGHGWGHGCSCTRGLLLVHSRRWLTRSHVAAWPCFRTMAPGEDGILAERTEGAKRERTATAVNDCSLNFLEKQTVCCPNPAIQKGTRCPPEH